MSTISNREIAASFIADTNFENLPSSVVTKTKYCILDLIGVSIAGSNTLSSKIASQFAVENFKNVKEATLFLGAQKISSPGAAYANSICASALDLDDGHRFSGGHPGSVIIPSGLAVAESQCSSGKQLIEAVVIAYEIAIRVAAFRKPSYKLSFSTGAWGTYGSCVAVSKLLNLNSDQIAFALGLAASHAPMRPQVRDYLWVPMVKECIGWAGLTGVSSAILAQKGFTAEPGYLDYDELFYTHQLMSTLGKKYEILNTYYKLYSSCRWTHAAIDAVLNIVLKNEIKSGEIKNIVVKSFDRATLMSQTQPATIESAQYSIPFCIGVAICYNNSGTKEISESQLTDSCILDVANKVTVVSEPSIQELFPGRVAAIVEVQTNNYKYVERVDFPLGDPENPVQHKCLQDKFLLLCQSRLSEKKARILMDAILNIEEIENVGFILDTLSSQSSLEHRDNL